MSKQFTEFIDFEMQLLLNSLRLESLNNGETYDVLVQNDQYLMASTVSPAVVFNSLTDKFKKMSENKRANYGYDFEFLTLRRDLSKLKVYVSDFPSYKILYDELHKAICSYEKMYQESLNDLTNTMDKLEALHPDVKVLMDEIRHKHNLRITV